jgi:hypothetical protein
MSSAINEKCLKYFLLPPVFTGIMAFCHPSFEMALSIVMFCHLSTAQMFIYLEALEKHDLAALLFRLQQQQQGCYIKCCSNVYSRIFIRMFEQAQARQVTSD